MLRTTSEQKIENNNTTSKHHVALFLDIDDTLIDFNKSKITAGFDSKPVPHVSWISGSPDVFIKYLTAFKEGAAEKNIQVHIGIATFRAKSDAISDEVLKTLREANANNKPLLDELIYFTGTADEKEPTRYKKNCKVVNGMKLGKEKIESEFKTTIQNKDVWILDDEYSVFEAATRAGFQCSQAIKFAGIDKEEQIQKIHDLFSPLFDEFHIKKLPSPSQSKARYSQTHSIFNSSNSSDEVVLGFDDEVNSFKSG